MNLEHVKFDEESWNYGDQTGYSVAIIDGDETIIRNAVTIAGGRHREIEAPVWSDPRKVYVTSAAEVPLMELEGWQDEDAERIKAPIFADDGGFFYLEPRVLLKPGRYEEKDLAAEREAAKERLHEWLRWLARAGELLRDKAE